jgi:hypothetical protein
MAKAEGETMDWKHLLAYITGTVDQALLLRNAYPDSTGFSGKNLRR